MEKIDLRLGDSAEIFHVSGVESDGGELTVDGGTIHHDGKGGRRVGRKKRPNNHFAATLKPYDRFHWYSKKMFHLFRGYLAIWERELLQ